MNNPYLLEALATGPGVVALAARQINSAVLDEVRVEGRFSAREGIAHLADVEPIMLGRLRQAVEEPGSMLVAFDESERAERFRYSEADVEEALAVFAERRAETVAYLASIGETDWEKVANHQQRGPSSVKDQAQLIVCHDLYHVAHLRVYGRVGG